MKQTSEQFKMMVANTFHDIDKLTNTKGEEYTSGKTDVNQHENFDRLAERLSMSPEQVLMVYLTKHLSSIETWVKDMADNNLRGLSEPISGRIDDAILYLLLLKGMYERRVNASTPHDSWGNDSRPQETVQDIIAEQNYAARAVENMRLDKFNFERAMSMQQSGFASR